jgi:sigma-B regulation protein RsbU (phosphoserine phosphatase)
VTLEAGDMLILYTDGSTEALDEAGLEFGLPRMVQSIQANALLPAQQIVQNISEELTTFVGKQRQYDDITLIALKRL